MSKGKSVLRMTYVTARRLVVALIGGTIVLLGIVMIVFPGPALVMIPLGLAVLGAEFTWAQRWLSRLREGANNHLDKLREFGNNPKSQKREGWMRVLPARRPSTEHCRAVASGGPGSVSMQEQTCGQIAAQPQSDHPA